MTEYFISHLWLLWLIVSILCLILEMVSSTFYILCLAVGALFACLFSFTGIPFWGQVLVFAITSLISIFAVRPFALSFLHKGEDKRESNVDALIGRTGTVIEEIEAEGSGYIKVDGDEWKAVSSNGMPISKGSKVRILSMNSIIATVEELLEGRR